jgi:xanthine dehydrogenase accessory factor
MNIVLIRGGGDLASGVALRLHHAGYGVVITELAQPLAVRRLVSFSEAIYDGEAAVEDVTAVRVPLDPERIADHLARRVIPILVDPEADILRKMEYDAVIDARLLKTPPQPLPAPAPLHIGLGPGFTAPRDCDAVVETRRGHTLGRVYWIGSAAPDNRHPEGDPRRVLRAPVGGLLAPHVKIGEHVGEEQIVAKIRDERDREVGAVVSSLSGVLRGLLRADMPVTPGMKIGDVDSRDDPTFCRLVSDKALAVGGGVLEAILTQRKIQNSEF